MDPENLSVLAYANGFTFWHYESNKTVDIDDGNYFSAAKQFFRNGDLILIKEAPPPGSISRIGFYVIKFSEGSADSPITITTIANTDRSG